MFALVLAACTDDRASPADASAADATPRSDATTDATPAVDGLTSADTDGDGIPDNREGADDVDGDGSPNYLDLDSDGDCIPDAAEAGADPMAPLDSDADGSYDFADADSDNDGLPDGCEDLSCDGVLDAGESSPTITDTDGDGFPDVVERAAGSDPNDAASGVPADAALFVLPYYDPMESKDLAFDIPEDIVGTVDLVGRASPSTVAFCPVAFETDTELIVDIVPVPPIPEGATIDPPALRNVSAGSVATFRVYARNTTVPPTRDVSMLAVDIELADGVDVIASTQVFAIVPNSTLP
jgi:hypothetical protein